jgi:hypothetical protein
MSIFTRDRHKGNCMQKPGIGDQQLLKPENATTTTGAQPIAPPHLAPVRDMLRVPLFA